MVIGRIRQRARVASLRNRWDPIAIAVAVAVAIAVAVAVAVAIATFC